MTTSTNENVRSLVATTMDAMGRSALHCFKDGLYLSGSTTLELYGEDAGLDFIETKWPELLEHLHNAARAKRANAYANIPRSGKRAKAAIMRFLNDALPGCEISNSGCSVSVSWKVFAVSVSTPAIGNTG